MDPQGRDASSISHYADAKIVAAAGESPDFEAQATESSNP